ncbi:MAG: hypothetical protein E7596_04975 [Ruminococcaceae bacterium]|nr:hypothetical protein [Oscillospiraceae bacterium]
MKKTLTLALMIMALLACMLAVSVSAEKTEGVTYYLVQDSSSDLAAQLRADGENVVQVADLYSKVADTNTFFEQFTDGASVTIRLAENITYSPSGANDNSDTGIYMCIKNPINVTVEFAGYTWWINSSKQYAGWRVYNAGASLTLIGTKGTDENKKPVVTNANEYSYNTPTTDIDFYGAYVGVYLIAGNVTFENVRGVSQEEMLYQKAAISGHYTHKIKDSSLSIQNTNCAVISLQAKDGCTKDLQVENCRLTSILIHNMGDNTYIKDTEIFGSLGGKSFWQDHWGNRNLGYVVFENVTLAYKYYSDGDGYTLKAKNCRFLGEIYLCGDSSGDASAELTDCEYVSYGGFDQSGSKAGTFTVITSATCEAAGSTVVYGKDGEISNAVIEKLAHQLGEITDVTYGNYFENGVYSGICTQCANSVVEEIGTAAPLFKSKGYSYTEYKSEQGYSIAQGFVIDKEMLGYMGQDVSFGIAAAVNTEGEEIKPIESGISMDLTNKKIADYLEIKIVGISEEYATTKLAFCAYIIDGGVVYYLDDNTTSTTIVGKSYEEIIKTGNNEGENE